MKYSTLFLLLCAHLLDHATGHSLLVSPEGITPETCRRGGGPGIPVENCAGPCYLRKLGIGTREVSEIRRGKDVFRGRSPGVSFYPPNKPAAVYRRGQVVTMKYTRNNHGPGGFVRYALVPLSFDWMNKDVHSKLAVHYSCWGETPVEAQQSELHPDRFGFSFVGSDGDEHSFKKGYYVNKMKIPDVIPDGKYMIGWSWYGGCGCPLRTGGRQAPCEYSYFADYWSCSFVEIKGGNPLAKEYKPVFVGSSFSNPKNSGCRAAHNSLGICTYEPCEGKKCKYQKPKEFYGSGPRKLTPADFGYTGAIKQVHKKRKHTPKRKPKIWKADIDTAVRSCTCIGMSARCTQRHEVRSVGCRRYTKYQDQPDSCKKSCCKLCKTRSKWRVCQRYATVKKICGL